MDRFGGRTRTRTLDPLIKSQLLYQLSYAPGTNDRGCSSHIGRAVASHTSSGMFGYPDFFLSTIPLGSKRGMRLHSGGHPIDRSPPRSASRTSGRQRQIARNGKVGSGEHTNIGLLERSASLPDIAWHRI